MRTYTWISALCLLISMVSCGKQRDFNPGTHIGEIEKTELLIRLNAYLEAKPDGASSSMRYDSAYRQVYVDRSTKNPFYLYSLYKNDEGRHWFQMVMHERKSLHDWKYRTIGGYYELAGNPNEFTDFDIIFYSKIMTEEEAKEKGREMFESMVDARDMDGFKDLVEWPNEEVRYDRETNNWEML